MRRIFVFIILVLACLLPLSAAAGEGTVPKAANQMAAQLDSQIMRRIGAYPGGRVNVSIAATVPVFLGDLERSSPLARQVAEEVTRYLVEAGYRVNEIRKGSDIVMIPQRGEMILTRQRSHLATPNVTTSAILAGTYTITDESVRFNLRLLHTPSNEILAMATATVPVTDELFPLLADRTAPTRDPLPNVSTRLR